MEEKKFHPYVPADKVVPEFTVFSVVLGALLAIVLMIGSYIISVKENYPKGSPFTIKGFIKQLGTSIWALAAVVIVVFGVVGGVFTATESAAIAVIYSLLVSVFVY